MVFLKSFNLNLLQFFIKDILKCSGFENTKVVNLPQNRKVWTVLKSPHVNSKSKEQFNMVVYSRIIVLNSNIVDLFYLVNLIKSRLVPGVLVKFKV
jgi:small subunit ribosomal protein S10